MAFGRPTRTFSLAGAALCLGLTASSALAVQVPESPLFPAYDEILDILDEADASSVAQVFDLVDDGGQAYSSAGGHDLRALKISDNPGVDEDEPTFLFVGSIHGDEPLGTRVILELIEELTEQYDSDPRVAEWVDSYEIWLVPVLNPDGYGSSDGRKNDNDVDLNRNFGFRWDRCSHVQSTYDCESESDSRYKGQHAFSEPESRALRDLVLRERPSFGITFHAGEGGEEGAIYYSWGTKDDELLVDSAVDWERIRPFAVAIADATGASLGTGQSSGQSIHYNHAVTGMLDFIVETTQDGYTGTLDSDKTEEAQSHVERWLEGVRVFLDQVLCLDASGNVLRDADDRVRLRGSGVVGRVRDAQGRPLRAEVRVVGLDETLQVDFLDGEPYGPPDLRYRQSDDHGRYLRFLAPGPYTLEFSRPGYKTETLSPFAGGTCPTESNVTLEPGYGPRVASGDFDNDGFADLALGLPDENVGGNRRTGVVKVTHGSSPSNGWIFEPLMSYAGQLGEELLGAALAVGDFDRDGFDDLAVGVPGATVGGMSGAGRVVILYGSRDGVAGMRPPQSWDQARLVLGVAAAESFGASLASGDFNRDGFDDLAIGAPGQKLGTAAAAGEVTVLRGSPVGLVSSNVRMLNRGTLGGTPQASAHFGASLAAGDFDRNGWADLAIGAPDEDSGTIVDSGRVNVAYGGTAGLSVLAGASSWSQAGDIAGAPEAGDHFGASLASGDFDRDGYHDLAVGVPDEDHTITGRPGVVRDAGMVNVIYGGAAGLAVARNQAWFQGATLGGYTVSGTLESGDRFGASLATGDVLRDGTTDLIVGAPLEDSGAGAVNVLRGHPTGLISSGNQLIRGADGFGQAVATGDFDRNGIADLVSVHATARLGLDASASVARLYMGGTWLTVHEWVP